MQTSRMRVLPGVVAALVLSIVPLACGSKGDKGESKAEAKAPAADGTPADVKAADDGAAANDGAAINDGAGASGEAGGGSAAEAGGPATSGGTGGAESGGPAAGSSGGDEAGGEATGGTTGGAVDTKALLKEIKSKRTKDDRLEAAMAEAEAAGVETLAVAKALNSRGEALFATPDRAKAMFELALEKDATYPKPAFNLAKQAAMLGELDEAKKWLTIVKERKGKKLLKEIDFDPMWEILKDDPEVRALLK